MMPAAAASGMAKRFHFQKGTTSRVMGSSMMAILDNINRWMRQFNLEAIDMVTLAMWSKVPVGADSEGVWVEAEGTYSPGMGKPPVPGQALAGIIAEADGGVLTIKMVGPAEEVKAQKEVLKKFAASVTWTQK